MLVFGSSFRPVVSRNSIARESYPPFETVRVAAFTIPRLLNASLANARRAAPLNSHSRRRRRSHGTPMTATYAVTFEFETRPPLTLRGAVSASGMPTCVARAARTAMREAGRQTWSSVVVVIARVNPSSAIGDANRMRRPSRCRYERRSVESTTLSDYDEGQSGTRNQTGKW